MQIFEGKLFFDENKLSEYIKTENYEVFIAKIAREVHDLKHRKLRKRKLRGRKLRGYGVSGAKCKYGKQENLAIHLLQCILKSYPY